MVFQQIQQREIAECTVLGMQTSVSKLSSSLESMSRDIAEDEGVISLLRGDAERIRDDVVKRVTEYTATGNPITAVQENVLGTIGVIMLRIGIASNDRLFHSNRSDIYISAKPPTYQPQQVSSKSNGHAPNSSESALAVESLDAPLKLKWASGSASKSQVKSLVDIQKEELSRKAN